MSILTSNDSVDSCTSSSTSDIVYETEDCPLGIVIVPENDT